MELGTKSKGPEGLPSTAESSEPKTSYPGITLRDDVADAFRKECPDCEVGEELTATVKLRVSGTRDDQYGKSVDFEVLSMDDISDEDENSPGNEGAPGEAEAEPEEGDESEEKILGYKRPKVSKEAPSVSAKDLM